MKSPEYWIRRLKLRAHPEGGYFRETYRAVESLPKESLPDRYAGPRVFSTSIYFLLKSGQVSHFHRLKSDEVWHFYDGSPLLFHVLGAEGRTRRFKLGRDIGKRESLQAVLPKGTWFGAEIIRPRSFSLCGCTVAPGFEFSDFEFGRREDLAARFPHRKSVIGRLAI